MVNVIVIEQRYRKPLFAGTQKHTAETLPGTYTVYPARSCPASMSSSICCMEPSLVIEKAAKLICVKQATSNFHVAILRKLKGKVENLTGIPLTSRSLTCSGADSHIVAGIWLLFPHLLSGKKNPPKFFLCHI